MRRWLEIAEVRAAWWSAVLLLTAVTVQLAGWPAFVPFGLFVACYVAAGWGPLVSGLRAAGRGVIDVDLLMVLAAVCAAGTGKLVDGALLFVIFACARALAAVALGRTRDSVRGLLELTPQHAVRITTGGQHESVAVEALAVGDEVLVGPGERVAADGEVVSGLSELDQATVTGESQLVAKGPGDDVFAGTVNGLGSLRIRVTREAHDFVVARIAAQVDQATATDARTQLVLQRLERTYSLAVVLVTAALLVVPYALGSDLRGALLRAMAFMIVASPCALMVATMPPLLAVVANAGRHGVLIKGVRTVEKLATVTTVAFDKTGSLTTGSPQVVDVAVLGGRELDAEGVVRLAAAVEQGNPHPLARAIVAEAVRRGVSVPESLDVQVEPGRGVHAWVHGRRVSVLSAAAVRDAAVPADVLDARGWAEAGLTVVVLLLDGRPVGAMAIADRPRDEARDAVDQLTRMVEHDVLMVTGDGTSAAQSIGEQVGIHDVRAQQLPAHKLDAVQEIQSAGQRVLFVGDGINDAPALAAAQVGVAVAGGADLAMETADVVVLHGRLMNVPAVLGLSRLAQRVVTQNLGFAATVVVALVGLDLVGTLPLVVAVIGHEGSTLIVALNSIRLLSPRAWRTNPRLLRRLTSRDVRRYAALTVACLALAAYAFLQLKYTRTHVVRR